MDANVCVSCLTPIEGSRCASCGAAGSAGGFTVVGLLAKSAHGRTYLATDAAGEKVALKELVFALVPSIQELAAFEREAALLAQLSHPRIPRFIKAFSEGTGTSMRMYLAQTYVPGESLANRLETHRFDEAEVLRLADEALEILAWLHARTPVVLHRDLKPGNLILGTDAALYLVDFGSARDLAGAATHRSTLVGTFGYIAPEQLGGTVEPRSDLYGLGATLIHLLTRKPPDQLLAAGMKSEFARVTQLSVRTERFLSRLVAPRLEDRFGSATEALGYLRGEFRAAPSKLLAVAASLALALAAGAIFLWKTPLPSEPPKIVSAPVEVSPPALPVAAPAVAAPGESGEPPPPSGKITFPWRVATWDFNKPGHWVLDGSGHGHHVRLPTRGFTSDFFGLQWDGTGGLKLRDSPDFALTRPFSVSVNLMLPREPNPKAAVLISRGDPNGAFGWQLSLEPNRVLRFSISDGKGQTSVVEGAISGGIKGTSINAFTVYASFDPTTGEQLLQGDCKVLGKAVTPIRPAQELPDPDLRLLEGFVGHVTSIGLEKGLWVASKGGNCGYSMEKIGE